MAYTTTTTSITSATSSRSKQATVYQYPTGNGVVITGASVNSNTTAYLGVTTPGAAQTYTAVSGGATITEIVYLDSDNVPTNANAVSTTGGNIKIVGTGFASGAQVYINNALVTNTVPNSTAIIATLTTGSVGNVSCYIFGSGNSGGAISANSVRFSGAPSWVTAAAVSSVNGIASNIALQASGDGTLTYVLKSGSGSLPTGITLLSNGYLTGTATGYSADTVVTFTLIVRDTENQATQQTFNYTVFIGDTYFKQTSLLLSATVSNTFISDSSTNNFLITRNGDTRPSRLSPYWPGGWSGYFDGTGDYLSLADSSAWTLGTNNFTIEFWINFLASDGSVQNIAGQSGSLGDYSNQSFVFYRDANNKINGYVVSGGATAYTCTSTASVTQNTWRHVALVRNNNTLTLYLDGSANGTANLTGVTVTNSSSALSIGRVGDYATSPINGYISNFRLVNGTAVYTANFTPSTTSLTTVANTSLLTLRDAILADDSPYNFAITRNGDTRLTTFSPFNTAPHTVTANTNSVYFDGTGDWLSVASNAEFGFGSNNGTVECWIYPTSFSAYPTLWSLRNTSALIYDNVLRINNDGNLAWSNGNQYINATTNPVKLNEWQHVAWTKSSSNIYVWLNGTQVITSSYSPTQSNRPCYIGATDLGEAPFPGYISNFRVVKGTAVYTANFTPGTSALTAISGTSLLACQANTIIDSNTTPKTITVNGNPNVSLANPFGETVSTISNYTWSPTSYGASAYFDAATDTRLTLSSNSAFAFGTGAYTVEAWVYLTAYSSPSKIFIDCGSTTNSFGLAVLSTGAFYINKYGTGEVFATTDTVPLNSWCHLAASRSSTSSNDTKLFINGKLAAIGTDNNNWTVTSTPSVGGIGVSPYTVLGYIQDVRITKGTALYTGPFIPPTAPLPNVANVSLLTLQSDIGSNSAQFVDQSPNNHLITRNGNASQGTYGPLVPSTWSAYFDGSGDYLTVPNNTAFNFGTGDFTIECWIYTISSATQRIISYANASNTPYELLLVNTGSNVYLDFYDGTSDLTTGSNYVAQNSWAHVAVTRSGTALRLFINGVISGSFTNSVNLTSAGSLFIGRYQPSDLQPFVGYISNLRIVKGTGLYTANFTPSTTTISPVANTSLLTLRGPAFTDDSGNNFTITRNGDTKIVPFGPFSPQIITPDSYSYRFSNASDYISTTSSNLAFGSNNWTIESWVYPRFTANSGIFQVSNVQYGLTNSNLNTVALGFSNSNKAIVRVANATYTSTGTSITANTWTHLALVKSSNVSKLYINGTLDSTIGTSGSITDTVSYIGTTNVAVGGYGSTSALANAYISNFRIVSNSAVYTDNFTPAVGPLSAISGTTLLTCQANTVLDSSAANLTITANANVSPSSFNPFDETVTVGQQYSALADGGSAYFDGTGDYLNAATSTAFGLGTGNFTIECWMYPTANPANGPGTFLDLRTGVTATATACRINNSLQLIFYNGPANVETAFTGRTISLNAWQHIAIVRISGTVYGYINGMLSGSVVASADLGSNQPAMIGQNQTAGYNFNGYLSNLRIIKGTALYTTAFLPPAAPALPTTANTSLLLNFTSSGVIDSTGRNILETVADAKVTTNLKKYGTGSYYFDGTGDYMYVMGNSTELAFGTGDFTVEFWMYTSNAAQTASIYGHRPYNTNGVYINIYMQSNSLKLYVNSADRITGGTLVNNTWHHVALARTGTSTKLFLDGTQIGSTYTDSNSYLNGTSRPLIGANDFDFGSPYSGYIADLRVTKGYARYTANFTVPSEPFITK